MTYRRDTVSNRPNHDVLRDEQGRFVKWEEKGRSNPERAKTFRAHNPQELVTLENPGDEPSRAGKDPHGSPAHSSHSSQTRSNPMDYGTEEFQKMLQTAGGVTAGAVIARRAVSPVIDRASNAVGLSGTPKRLVRLAGLSIASVVAMRQDSEMLNSIGVGHGVAVVEDAIDWGLALFQGAQNGGSGGGDGVEGVPLLPTGLGSGYASEYGAAANASVEDAMAQPSFAPGS